MKLEFCLKLEQSRLPDTCAFSANNLARLFGAMRGQRGNRHGDQTYHPSGVENNLA